MLHSYRIPPDPAQLPLAIETDDPFNTWARLYFKRKRLNAFVPYREALSSFQSVSQVPVGGIAFKRRLCAWCARKGYQLDPVEHRNSAGRIIRKHEVALGKWVATEMLFIKTQKQNQ